MDVTAEAHEVATRLPVVVYERGAITVVEVGGELDGWTAPALCRRLEAQVAAGAPSLLIDLSAVQACEEQALRALAGVVHEARERQVRVAVLKPALADVGCAFDDADALAPLPVAANAEHALHELS